MDTENDAYWRKRVETAEAEAKHWKEVASRLKASQGSDILDVSNQKQLWKESADTFMSFIKKHIAIVGHKEITGFAKCKEAYNKAVLGE